MAKPTKPGLRLLVNQKPFSAPAFDARVAQCEAELRPVIDRLIDRHGAVTVFGALIEECGGATIGAAIRGKVDARVIAHISKRLQLAIERAGAIRPDNGGGA